MSNTVQLIGLWLLQTLWKCGSNKEVVSASVVANLPLSSCTCMKVGEAWWLVFPPERTRTLSHTYLWLKRIGCCFLIGVQTMLLFPVQWHFSPQVAQPWVVASTLINIVYLYWGFFNEIAVCPFLLSGEGDSHGWNETILCSSDCWLLHYCCPLLGCTCYSQSI